MKVLIADDDPVSRRLLQVSLGNEGYPVTIACDGAEALHALQQLDCPQLAVLDWMMPKIDGIDICRKVRTLYRDRYVYIILLTAKGHQGEIVQGLEAGADDYITKPYDMGELKARLRAGRRIVELQEQLVTARECLRVQAMHDSLTGLHNRMAILEALEKEMARFNRDSVPLAITMVDLDHFKHINDTLGHAAGDAVLCEVAQRMRSVTRTGDIIGRCGGEEFLIVSPRSDLRGAQSQAERIRQNIAGRAIRYGDKTISVTASLGVAEAGASLSTANELLRTSDEALYQAKHDGRNKTVGLENKGRLEKGSQASPTSADLCPSS